MFQGAKETILRCRPVVIFSLLPNPPCKGRVPDDILVNAMKSKKLLESYGYTVMLVDPINYIGFPAEKMAQIASEAKKRRQAKKEGKRLQKRH